VLSSRSVMCCRHGPRFSAAKRTWLYVLSGPGQATMARIRQHSRAHRPALMAPARGARTQLDARLNYDSEQGHEADPTSGTWGAAAHSGHRQASNRASPVPMMRDLLDLGPAPTSATPLGPWASIGHPRCRLDRVPLIPQGGHALNRTGLAVRTVNEGLLRPADAGRRDLGPPSLAAWDQPAGRG
jgi:hypothetical protein